MKDLKIVNGRVPCFETRQWLDGDVLIHEGKIVAVGKVFEETTKTIDAKGKIISPGFIDLHAHEDPIIGGEDTFFTASCELRMGVTTKVGGNCGENYDELSDFCKHIENGSPTNYMMFVGQNFLRIKAGAMDRYKASTKQQLDAMKKHLGRIEKLSPVGLSCGFEYAPGVTTEETIELLKAFDGEGYLTSVHFRSDGAESVNSIEELLEISRKSGYGIQMSHIGSCSAVGYMEPALEMLRAARKNGLDIMADCYPYTAFCTGIGTAVFDEGCFEKWGKNYGVIQITSGEYKNQRCTKEIFEKLRREEPEMSVVAFVMNEDEVEKAYKESFVMVGSDCGFTNRCGHPRGAGTYPRVLSRYVREKKVLSMMEALEKMTYLPAKRLKLNQKGQIKVGYDADIVIFNEITVLDKADFDCPTEAPDGIEYVLINGKVAVKENNIVNGSLGRYIPYKNI